MSSITRGPDDEGHRWYEVELDDGSTHRALSVTQILSLALEEDETGLDIWRSQNDGTNDAPYWQHLFWYSGPRGTLCHYHALSHFEEHFEDEDMWGPEEGEAMQKILNGPSEKTVERWNQESSHHVPGDLDSITYSVMKDEGIVDSRDQYRTLFQDSTTLADVLRDDVDFFLDKFKYILDKLEVTEEDVVRVEKKLLDHEEGYGGQCDLVYLDEQASSKSSSSDEDSDEDQDGGYVLADLKTSSGLRQKHVLQSVAYKHAVQNADWGPDEIDRLEVWRIAPSKRAFEVHADHVPDHAADLDWYTDDYWFTDPYGDWEYDDLDDMWDTFKSLTDEAHDVVDEGE